MADVELPGVFERGEKAKARDPCPGRPQFPRSMPEPVQALVTSLVEASDPPQQIASLEKLLSNRAAHVQDLTTHRMRGVRWEVHQNILVDVLPPRLHRQLGTRGQNFFESDENLRS